MVKDRTAVPGGDDSERKPLGPAVPPLVLRLLSAPGQGLGLYFGPLRRAPGAGLWRTEPGPRHPAGGDRDLPGAASDPGRAGCLARLRLTALRLPHNADRTLLPLRQRGATGISGVTGPAANGPAVSYRCGRSGEEADAGKGGGPSDRRKERLVMKETYEL